MDALLFSSLSVPQVSATGSVLRSEILGCIKLKVVLSGMPELRLGLNDKVLFEITGSECTLYWSYIISEHQSADFLCVPSLFKRPKINRTNAQLIHGQVCDIPSS